MKIAVVGTGYVGLVTGTCIAEMGNHVTCVDVDSRKIENLKKGIIPIFEAGLEPMVKRNIQKKSLFFTTNLKEALQNTEVVFIAVVTPMSEDDSSDIQYVLQVAKEIGQDMTKELIIVDKSTVPVGTAEKVTEVIANELDKRGVNISFDVVSNPEFLKEGAAVEDFMRPDRIVVGANNFTSLKKIRTLYYPFLRNHDRLIEMDVKSAEMTKYAANAMLATKISFINEIANICELVGADVNMVRIGIGSDKRIGYDFIYPGIGYGGSCFPKDIKALIKTAKDNGYYPKLISSVEGVNDKQKLLIAKKIINKFGENLSGKTFAFWGLAFKPGTDDMREAPAIYLMEELIKHGAKIQAYDPQAMDEAKKNYFMGIEDVQYFDSKYEALHNADALLLLTEWKEFRAPDFEEIKKQLAKPIIFDGRNQYSNFDLKEKGFDYYQIGKK